MSTVARDAGALAPAKVGASRARFWWTVHQWAGLKFSIFLSFILFTGTLAVLSSEMDWAMRPALRVSPSSVSGPVNWPAIAGNAAAEYPHYRVVSIDAPVASAFAASVMVEHPDGRHGYLYAHPTTGAIQGEGHWIGAKRILRNMHRHLNLPVWIGVPIVGSLAFLLAISLGTSLIVYKKWWRGWMRPIRTRDARTGWGDFHRLAGVWSLWFALLIIATGVWYFVEEIAAPAPPLPSVQAPSGGLDGAALANRLEASLAAARAADPELRIRQVSFPGEDEGAFVFQGQRSAILVRDRANSVWTDAATARPLLATDGRDLTVHQRISEMADPLHFGTFGGYWTKIPWFLFGLLLTALSVSGVALYSLRLIRGEHGRARTRGVIARAWMGMGHWRWPAVAAVVTGFVFLPELWTQ